MFQSSAHLVLVSLFAAFLAVAFTVVASGSKDQRNRRASRPGDPVRVESRGAVDEWTARQGGHRRRDHHN